LRTSNNTRPLFRLINDQWLLVIDYFMIFNRDHIIKLTLVLYQVTDRFPKNEPLRVKIREKANDILAFLVSINPTLELEKKAKIVENIRAIKAYFEIAKRQSWVDPKNFDVLKREYNKIYQEIKNIKNIQRETFVNVQNSVKEAEAVSKTPSTKKAAVITTKEKDSPEQRQKKILELIQKNGKINLTELKLLFPKVSPRTLRRDMENLINKGIITRRRLGKKDVLYEVRENKEIGHNYGQI